MMSPRTSEQFMSMRDSAIENILSSALNVFLEKGYHGATMSEIAKKANISIGSTYHYFASKEELLKAIMKKRIGEPSNVIMDAKQMGAAEQQLTYLIDRTVEHVKLNVDLYRFYFTIFLQPGAANVIEEISGLIKEWFTEIYNYELDLFKEIRPDNSQVETVLFRSTFQGIVLDYVKAPELYPLDLIKERLLTQYTAKQG